MLIVLSIGAHFHVQNINFGFRLEAKKPRGLPATGHDSTLPGNLTAKFLPKQGGTLAIFFRSLVLMILSIGAHLYHDSTLPGNLTAKFHPKQGGTLAIFFRSLVLIILSIGAHL